MRNQEDGFAPASTKLQLEAAREQSKKKQKVPKVCVVTGGTGFVGQRLVEMLIERGAEKVFSFDIVPPHKSAWKHSRIVYVTGDITDKAAVNRVCEGADCVWHIAACVGPFHPKPLYRKVNYEGTINVIDACKRYGVPKLIMSSSPSTRMDGSDIDGLNEAQLPSLPMPHYLQDYAETKALGELACRRANCDDLWTCAIAPHQVYGPRDNLFLPNVLEAAGSGKLRVFAKSSTGWGLNKVCFTHVDNYCHGLILAERALVSSSCPVAGSFYIVTDAETHTFREGYGFMWKEIDKAIVAMGFASIWTKIKLPFWFLMIIAYVCNVVGWMIGKKLKLNPFNIKVMTMHRWFKTDKAKRDLGYEPIISFGEGWADTCAWFKIHWLPKFLGQGEDKFFGIAKQSLRKIEIQNKGTRGAAGSTKKAR